MLQRIVINYIPCGAIQKYLYIHFAGKSRPLHEKIETY